MGDSFSFSFQSSEEHLYVGLEKKGRAISDRTVFMSAFGALLEPSLKVDIGHIEFKLARLVYFR